MCYVRSRNECNEVVEYMPCFHPLQAFFVSDDGLSHEIVFGEYASDKYPLATPVKLPCGKCVGCRLERSRQWAVRCMHEASLYDDNCFITLTYDNEHLPVDGSLDKSHFQNFMKRFRQKCGSGIRYYHCGEYGEKLGRPHYHACIFNFDFDDKVYWKSSNGLPLYTSSLLSSLWTYGFSSIGNLTFESAAYVARYCMKKVNGDPADEHYQGRQPEYATMSNRPGIGRGWIDKFGKTDVFPHDYVVVNGSKCKPPRYYDKVLDSVSPVRLEQVKELRMERASGSKHNTVERLFAREECQLARLSRLKRDYER